MQKVTIIPYLRKDGVADLAGRLIDWLEARGVGAAIPEIEAGELGMARYAADNGSLFKGSDLVIALGGDGTTLRAVRMMGENTLPVLGVNLGEIGFLMKVAPDDLEEALEKIYEGRFRLEERLMLRADIVQADGSLISRLALNDVLIGREEFSRLVKMDVYVNGVLFCRYAADGVIAATPTGSTAYSFSAGGPFISPATAVYVLTPICPHSLNNRSLVFNETDRLAVKPASTEPIGNVGVSIDGVPLPNLGKVETINISLAEQRFKFINLNGLGFYESLGQKLKRWLGIE